MKLIGLAGPAGSGKSAVAEFLIYDHGFASYGFADPLKKALNAAFGFTMDQWDDREWKERDLPWLPGVSPRLLAQTLGTEWGRDCIDPELWIKLADRWLDTLQDMATAMETPIAGVVFPDMRFENEAAWIRLRSGTIWHVQRKGSVAVREHVSEQGIDMFDDELILFNNDTLEMLRLMVSECIDELVDFGGVG